jgi:DNA-binding response OmpR family regulator
MKTTILFVDDEKDLLEMYQEFLDSEGFNVLTAASGEDAVIKIKENADIKLVISDSNMGSMSGLDLLKIIRRDYKESPLFYLSTGDVNQSEEDITRLGGNRLVLKPFDLDEILTKIKIDLKL